MSELVDNNRALSHSVFVSLANYLGVCHALMFVVLWFQKFVTSDTSIIVIFYQF